MKNKHSAMFQIYPGNPPPHKLLSPKFDKNLNFASMDQEEKTSRGFGLFTFSIEVNFKFLSNFKLKSLWGVPEDMRIMAICLFFFKMVSLT